MLCNNLVPFLLQLQILLIFFIFRQAAKLIEPVNLFISNQICQSKAQLKQIYIFFFQIAFQTSLNDQLRIKKKFIQSVVSETIIDILFNTKILERNNHRRLFLEHKEELSLLALSLSFIKQILFKFIICQSKMSEEKDKHFSRQQNRFKTGAGTRRELNSSLEVKNSFSQGTSKIQSSSNNEAIVKQFQPSQQIRTPLSFATSTQENLKRLISSEKSDLQTLIKDKGLRQDLKKQEKRVTKIRNDNKIQYEADNEISLIAINKILTITQEYINDVNKEKLEKNPVKSMVRLNQQKEIIKNLTTINEQMQLKNFASVKSTIQILLKKYGKDQLLQQKLSYLNFILQLNEQFEKDATICKDLLAFVEKIGSIDTAPQNIMTSVTTLKNTKKQLTIGLNKQNKKAEPNEKVVGAFNNLDKIGGTLLNYIQPKVQKKIEVKSKRQLELQKQLSERIKSGQLLDQSFKYCKSLFEKSTQNKQELIKQLQLLRKNKKKSLQTPYNLLLKIYDLIIAQKKQINQLPLYLKFYSQLFLRKNLNAEGLLSEIKKLDEKYSTNQSLLLIKGNIDILVVNVQEKQKSGKQISTFQLENKKLRAEKQKLQKVVQEQRVKLVEYIVDLQKGDKKKQLQQKRAKEAQRIKIEKQQKQSEKNVEHIQKNLQEKNWKIVKTSINNYNRKFQKTSNQTLLKILNNLATISNLIQQLQASEAKALQAENKQRMTITNMEKQKEIIVDKYKQAQQYEVFIKNLLQNFNQEGFVIKKYFEDLRRDRKKITQQKYQILSKLEEPLAAWRMRKINDLSENKNLSLSLSSVQSDPQLEKIKQQRQQLSTLLNKQKQKSNQLQTELKQSGKGPTAVKDAQQLISLVKRIQKGGEWWKFMPKNLKSSSFKQVYSLLEKYRQNELAIQRLMINQQLFKEEGETINKALDQVLTLFLNNSTWLSEQTWDKKLATYKGNKNCDKLTSCLKQLTSRANFKMEEQRKNYANSISGYESQIQRLANLINQLQKKKETYTEKSSSKLQESSSKKSVELKSSRRSSKSKEKDSHTKDAIQQYIQQQRNLLSKIQQLSQSKQHLQIKSNTIEEKLITLQKKLEEERVQFENVRFGYEKIKLQHMQKINELEGQLQISDGRLSQLQARMDSQIQSLKNSNLSLNQQVLYHSQRQKNHQSTINNQKASSEIELKQLQGRLNEELNYYRQMYGNISLQLQDTKQNESRLKSQLESIKRNNQVSQKIQIHQQSHLHDQNSKKINYKINLDSSKIFELYVDEPPVGTVKRQTNIVEVNHIPQRVIQQNHDHELRQQIASLKLQLENMQNETNKIIETQVINALKVQESDFNQFLKRFEAEKYHSFMTQILPVQIAQELARIKSLESITNPVGLHQSIDTQQIFNDRLLNKRRQWQLQTNQKIQYELQRFEQQTLPIIIGKIQIDWQLEKEKQWQMARAQIDKYWIQKIQDEKKQYLVKSSEQYIVKSQPTSLELLAIVRQESNKWFIDSLLEDKYKQWQQQKDDLIQTKQLQVDEYWQKTYLPQKYREWQADKQRLLQIKKIQWIAERDRQWEIKIRDVIIPEQISLIYREVQSNKINQVQIPAVDAQHEALIIQDWKLHNLPHIIEAEINAFINIEVPRIIQREREIWIHEHNLTLQKIIEQHKIIWQQEKQNEIISLNQLFDIKLHEILTHEHLAWKTQTDIQLKAIREQQQQKQSTIPESIIQQILQKEKKHWDLVKLQQIRRIQLEFQTRLNEIQRNLNTQIIDYQEKYLQEKNRLIQTEANAISRWKNNQLPLILLREKEAWNAQFRSGQLSRVVGDINRQFEQVLSAREKDFSLRIADQRRNHAIQIQNIRTQYESQLIKERQSKARSTLEKVTLIQQQRKIEYIQWEKTKELQWQSRVKEIENYWQTVIIPEREQSWKKQQQIYIEQLINDKMGEVQSVYQTKIIPTLLQEEKKKYQVIMQNQKNIWLSEVPQLINSGKYNHLIQPIIEAQAQKYETQIRKQQSQTLSSHQILQKLQNQIVEYQTKIKQIRNSYEYENSKIKQQLLQQEVYAKHSLQESQRLNQELTRSMRYEKDSEELRKIIELQKSQLSKMTSLSRDCQRLRQQNLQIQQQNNNLQRAKWQEINDIRSNFEIKIVQLTTQRTNLQTRLSQIDSNKREVIDRDSLSSLQRQISTLSSTLKTKDAQIVFLKKTIQNLNAQLRDNHDRLSEQLQKRGNAQRLTAQLRNTKLQLDYQIKYLKDREQSLIKKIDLKEQQINNLRKKIEHDNQSIEKKLKSSLELTHSYQLKFSQLETLLSIKTKEHQNLFTDIDRIKFENQSLSTINNALTAEKEGLRRQLRQGQSKISYLQSEKERYSQQSIRTSNIIIQKDEQIRRIHQSHSRISLQTTNQISRLQSELKNYKQELLRVQVQLGEVDRIRIIESQRASKLQRQLSEVNRDSQHGQIQILKKINQDVTNLTSTNRQLQLKCIMLENKERITSSSTQAINFFLLIQQHTDSLIAYLLKESIIPNMEIYHKFLNLSKAFLPNGRIQEYFDLWQSMVKELFQQTLQCRSEEMKAQAEQLLKLRDQMNEVLERQIEVSEADQNQLLDDYKNVLNDIKSIVKEYVRCGDDEYLRLLCMSLGISS